MTQRKTGSVPALLSAADLLALEIPEPRWAIEDLLPEGLVLLAGKPKCGKSWLALLWALLVAGGSSFGAFRASRGKVLYLALEDTQRRLKTRLGKLGIGKSAGDLMLTTEWPDGAHGLRAYLAKNTGVRLVVIDTLARLYTGRSPRTGQSAYAADYEMLAPLKKLADEFGICVLVVTHTRKAGAADVFDTVTGTRGVTGTADAIMVLNRAGAGCVLNSTGRDLETRDVHLTWHTDKCLWWPIGGRGEPPLSPERRKVVEAIRGAGRPLTPKGVADLTGANVGAVRKLLREMVGDGQVDEADGHGYTVPASNTPPLPHTPRSPLVGNGGNAGNGKRRGRIVRQGSEAGA